MNNSDNIKDYDFDLLKLISIIIKNIKLIIVVSFIIMILTLTIMIISKLLPSDKSFLPDQYSPKSIVILNRSSESSGIDSLLGSSGMSALTSISGISSGLTAVSDSAIAIKLVTTNSFINKIANKFDLYKVYKLEESEYPKTELKDILKEKLKLSEDEATQMLEISYTDTDKYLATEIVNSVTDLLEEEFNKIDVIRNSDQFNAVNDKIMMVSKELERLQREIIIFQTTHNLIDVDMVADKLITQVSSFQTQLLNKEVEIESYGKISSIRDPGYIKLMNERDAIVNAIQKLESGEVGDFPPIKELPNLSLELNNLKLEAEIQANAYKILVQQSEVLKLTAKGNTSTFQVLEYADVPEIKSQPGRARLLILISFMGFFLSIIYVLLREAWINIKNDPDKMKRLMGEV